MVYEVCFDLWTLTYCEEAVEQFGASGALNALIKQVLTAPREKIIRVILAAFRVRMSFGQISDSGSQLFR